MLIFIILPFPFMPLNFAYSFKQENRKISYDVNELVLSPQPTEDLDQVYEGPDPDALYLRLQSGEYEIIDPPAEFLSVEHESVIILLE